MMMMAEVIQRAETVHVWIPDDDDDNDGQYQKVNSNWAMRLFGDFTEGQIDYSFGNERDLYIHVPRP